eukprot:5915104-Amphidinium_carterae.1
MFWSGVSLIGLVRSILHFNLFIVSGVSITMRYWQDAASVSYLRPETAQGIFINFKNAGPSASAHAQGTSPWPLNRRPRHPKSKRSELKQKHSMTKRVN